MMHDSPSAVLFQQLQGLRRKTDLLREEIAKLEATVSEVIADQEERIIELESWVNPYSDCGEALCNSYLDSYK